LCLHLKEGGLGYARELTVVFKLTNCLWIYGQDVFEQRLSVEFRTEVDMLSQVDHLNLVKLIGYMEENSERILVVEYVPNGNLREHLDGTLPTYIRTDLDTFPQFFIS
jgi:serine/threonine protein kinase